MTRREIMLLDSKKGIFHLYAALIIIFILFGVLLNFGMNNYNDGYAAATKRLNEKYTTAIKNKITVQIDTSKYMVILK